MHLQELVIKSYVYLYLVVRLKILRGEEKYFVRRTGFKSQLFETFSINYESLNGRIYIVIILHRKLETPKFVDKT